MARTVNYKPRRQFGISEFGGVDLSSSPVKISKNRAAYMKNFYKDGGVIKKRPGYREVTRCGDAPISKIYSFKDKLLIFCVREGNLEAYEYDPKACVRKAILRTDGKGDITESIPADTVEAFYSNERYYIATGRGFYVLYLDEGSSKFVLKSIKDVAYIPTTTVGIADEHSPSASLRYNLEAVNMVTPYRKNVLEVDHSEKRFEFFESAAKTFESDYESPDQEYFINYTWNTPIIESAESYFYEIIFEARENQETKSITMTGQVENGYIFFENSEEVETRYSCRMHIDTGWINLEIRSKLNLESAVTLASNSVVTLSAKRSPYREWQLDCDADSYVYETSGEIKLEIVDLDGNIIIAQNSDSSDLYNIVDKNGELIATLNQGRLLCFADVSNYSSITVTFPHSSERGGKSYESLIGGCTFGVLFGTTGNSNRLFLSGNSDFPNIEFWSESDYTYFPDTNYNSVGSDITAVVGYLRLSDEVLCVFKEKSAYEPTVYYKSGKYSESYDDKGNLVYSVTTFPTYAGNVGETILSREASLNFGGDSLILSEEGVFGIMLRENVNTEERYMAERSGLIKNALKGYDRDILSSAAAVSFEGRYYLSVPDEEGTVYIADSRYKCTLESSFDSSFNYEWFVWKNIGALAFCVHGGKLYFGTKEGRICVFDTQASDRIKHTELVSVNAEDGSCFTVSEDFIDKIQLEMPVSFKSEEDIIFARGESDEPLVIGGVEYLPGDALPSENRFVVRSVDRENCCFSVSDYPYYDTRTLSCEGLLYAEFTEVFNIVAEWRSGVLDLGTITDAKTLLSMTLSAKASSDGKLFFGYSTKYGGDERESRGIQVLDFFAFDFTRFSFDNDYQSSYTVKCYERNFNYIEFVFRSEKGKVSINDFVATYKVNKKIRGIR